MLAPVLTFGLALVISSDSLSIATAFTSLTIMGLIVGPLAQLLTSFPNFISSLGSFERLQTFIEACEARANTYHANDPSRPQTVVRRPSTESEESIRSETFPLPKDDLLILNNASCSPKVGEPAILHDVSLVVKRSSLNLVLGKVGSGKSLLLRALLGELPVTQGTLRSSAPGVAFCTQSPWLVNASIRQNIVDPFGTITKIDKQWYNKVCQACALDTDFSQLSLGDLSLVGNRGLTLSGGQKQRVVSSTRQSAKFLESY